MVIALLCPYFPKWEAEREKQVVDWGAVMGLRIISPIAFSNCNFLEEICSWNKFRNKGRLLNYESPIRNECKLYNIFNKNMDINYTIH